MPRHDPPWELPPDSAQPGRLRAERPAPILRPMLWIVIAAWTVGLVWALVANGG